MVRSFRNNVLYERRRLQLGFLPTQHSKRSVCKKGALKAQYRFGIRNVLEQIGRTSRRTHAIASLVLVGFLDISEIANDETAD
ncbi:hypothetical protein MTO96_008780 [Rhipicephalus appendiculatus]